MFLFKLAAKTAENFSAQMEYKQDEARYGPLRASEIKRQKALRVKQKNHIYAFRWAWLPTIFFLPIFYLIGAMSISTFGYPGLIVLVLFVSFIWASMYLLLRIKKTNPYIY